MGYGGKQKNGWRSYTPPGTNPLLTPCALCYLLTVVFASGRIMAGAHYWNFTPFRVGKRIS